MSELLLQTIVEKLETVELALLKQNTPDNETALLKLVTEQFKELRSDPGISSPDFKSINENIKELRKRLEDLNFRSQQSLQTNIEHKHHLHKGIWISGGLLITAVFLLWGWITSYQNNKVFEANDIKYRALKVTGSKPLLEFLYKTDSLYNIDKDKFCKYVETKENQLIKQAEMLRIACEKKKRSHR